MSAISIINVIDEAVTNIGRRLDSATRVNQIIVTDEQIFDEFNRMVQKKFPANKQT